MIKERVSDRITIKDIMQWKNDIVTITAGCGAGKSFFIKNVLYELARRNSKKILLLLHRTNCKNQFVAEIEESKKTDIIDIKLYQTLEALYAVHKKEFDFSEYEYIVCDEFHYFLGDAAFNIVTDVSLNMILKQDTATRIFMSATSDSMIQYINNVKKIETIDYEFDIDYDFIDNLSFFMSDKSLDKCIDEAIQKNVKCIFFIQSAKKAYSLFKKYKKYCLFNCSKSNINYKYVDKDKIDLMLKNQKFDELILITTTSLDAGVNIVDTELKNIFIDVEDIGTLVQCLGRKRIQSDSDKVDLYIKTITNQQLAGKSTQLKKKIKMADFFKTHSLKEYIEEYYRTYDSSRMVYDESLWEQDKGTKKLNELMYFKCKFDISDISAMLKIGKFGYNKYLANKFGFMQDGYFNYTILEEQFAEETLEEYLDSIIGEKIFKNEQKELIDKIGLKDAKRRIQKSINQFNVYFEENKMPYTIISKTTKDKNQKTVRYWEINSLTG